MFYAGEQTALRRQLERCFLGSGGPGQLPKAKGEFAPGPLALVVPHAGYDYSGACAAHGYAAAALTGDFQCVAIVGPNHSGLGAPVAAYPGDAYRTPLGLVPAAKDIAQALVAEGAAEMDEWGHTREHSLEVQLPFLQFVWGDAVPPVAMVAMFDQSLPSALRLGRALAAACKGRAALLIASTDLSHFHPQAEAELLDRACLEPILAMNPEGLVKLIEERGISMCGYGPVAAILTAAKALGLERPELLCYTNSGEVSGDRYRVVGYASIVVR